MIDQCSIEGAAEEGAGGAEWGPGAVRVTDVNVSSEGLWTWVRQWQQRSFDRCEAIKKANPSRETRGARGTLDCVLQRARSPESASQ
jgi:hypothetical protein